MKGAPEWGKGERDIKQRFIGGREIDLLSARGVALVMRVREKVNKGQVIGAEISECHAKGKAILIYS